MSDIAEITTTSSPELDFLMKRFVDEVPQVWAVQLATGDGLKLAGHNLDKDQADYLSAIIAHHQPQFDKNLRMVTRSAKTVHEDTVVTAGDTLVFIVSAGENTILCALANRQADIGLVGFELGELVRRVGEHLGAKPRGADGSQTPTLLG